MFLFYSNAYMNINININILLLLFVPEVVIVEIIVSLQSYRLHVHSSRFLDPKFHLLAYYYYYYYYYLNMIRLKHSINNR